MAKTMLNRRTILASFFAAPLLSLSHFKDGFCGETNEQSDNKFAGFLKGFSRDIKETIIDEYHVVTNDCMAHTFYSIPNNDIGLAFADEYDATLFLEYASIDGAYDYKLNKWKSSEYIDDDGSCKIIWKTTKIIKSHKTTIHSSLLTRFRYNYLFTPRDRLYSMNTNISLSEHKKAEYKNYIDNV